tara:strand:+ start:237 stop:755 length:519 start_codon:yes stop_codon:yes gene_type:complete
MSELHLVDGYNILHKCSWLKSLLRHDLETAREALIDKVAHFCSHSGTRVTIVFDGRGRKIPEKVAHNRSVGSLKILYSPSQLTADSVIERMVYETPRKMDVVVVTNDRGVRDLCRGMGALVMDAQNFLSCIQESSRATSETVKRTQAPMPHHLGDRLDASSLEALDRLRKKL